MSDRVIYIDVKARTDDLSRAQKMVDNIGKQKVEVKCVAQVDGKVAKLNFEDVLKEMQDGKINQLGLDLDISGLTSQLKQAQQVVKKSVDEIQKDMEKATASRAQSTLRNNYIGKKSVSNNSDVAQKELTQYYEKAKAQVEKFRFDSSDLQADVDVQHVYNYIKALAELKTVIGDIQTTASNKKLSIGIDFDTVGNEVETELNSIQKNALDIIQNFGKTKSASLPPIIEQMKSQFLELAKILSGETSSIPTAEFEDLKANLTEAKQKVEELQRALENSYSTDEYEELSNQLKEAEKDAASLSDTIAELKDKLQESQDYSSGVDDQLKAMETEAQKYKQAIESLKSQLASKQRFETNFQSLVDSVKEINESLRTLKETISGVDSEGSFSSLLHQIDEVTASVEKLVGSTEKIHMDAGVEESQLTSLANKITDITTAIEKKNEAFEKEGSIAGIVSSSVSQEIADLESLKEKIDEVTKSLKKYKTALSAGNGNKKDSKNTSVITSIKKAIEKLNSLPEVSGDTEDKAQRLDNIFKTLAGLKSNPTQIDKITKSMKSLSKIDFSALQPLGNINFDNLLTFNNLKIGKNTFDNLSEGISKLANSITDVSILERLSKIDFSGLNNINGVGKAVSSSVALSSKFVGQQQSRIDKAIGNAKANGLSEDDLSELKSLSSRLQQDYNPANIGSIDDIAGSMRDYIEQLDKAIQKVDELGEKTRKNKEAQIQADNERASDLKRFQSILAEREKLSEKYDSKKGWNNQDAARMRQIISEVSGFKNKYKDDLDFKDAFTIEEAQMKDIEAKYATFATNLQKTIDDVKKKYADKDLDNDPTYQALIKAINGYETNQTKRDNKSKQKRGKKKNNSKYSKQEQAEEALNVAKVIEESDAILTARDKNLSAIDKISKNLRSKYSDKTNADYVNPEEFQKVLTIMEQIQQIRDQGIISDADVERVKQLQEQVKEIEKGLVSTTTKKGSYIGQISNAGTKQGIEELKQMIKLQEEANGNKVEFGSATNGYLGFNYNVVTKTGELRKYTASIEEGTGAVRTLMKGESEYISSGQRFVNSIKGKFAELTRYFSIMDVFQKALEFVKKGVSAVVEIDTAMTELKKVTDETTESYSNFQKQAGKIASDLGSTTSDVITATGDYARLGHSLEESAELAKSSVILKNVSEYETISEATDALTAMTQAYRELDSMEITDKLNKIGNEYSISTEGLATGLQKSASVLSLMGNSFDEAAALITAGNATLQDVDSVAAGLRTISLRIVGTEEAKKELEGLGEDTTDYVVQTAAKQRAIIMDYTAVASNGGKGVDILDENGNYKNTYDILLQIAEVYKEIQEEDKQFGTNRAQALVEVLAGKNRSSIASSILSNSEMLKAVKESSENAAGSAMAENEKMLDSVEGKILQLKANFQNLWSDAIDPGFLGGLIDIGSTLLKIIDYVGLLKTAIIGLVAVASFKGAGRDKINSFPSFKKMPADNCIAA